MSTPSVSFFPKDLYSNFHQSLLNFILPKQFAGSIDSLRAIFKVKGDTKVTLLSQERVSRAKKMMTPFVLRRRKDQVLVIISVGIHVRLTLQQIEGVERSSKQV